MIKQDMSSGQVSFISKVSKVKTRTKANKSYYVYRMNIPKDESDKLHLSQDDYLFVQAKKAQWYHMLNWKEMQTTWKMIPSVLKNEIKQSGLEVPDEIQLQKLFEPMASPTGSKTAIPETVTGFNTSLASVRNN